MQILSFFRSFSLLHCFLILRLFALNLELFSLFCNPPRNSLIKKRECTDLLNHYSQNFTHIFHFFNNYINQLFIKQSLIILLFKSANIFLFLKIKCNCFSLQFIDSAHLYLYMLNFLNEYLVIFPWDSLPLPIVIVYFPLHFFHSYRLFSLYPMPFKNSGFANFLINYAKITAVGIAAALLASNLSIFILSQLELFGHHSFIIPLPFLIARLHFFYFIFLFIFDENVFLVSYHRLIKLSSL